MAIRQNKKWHVEEENEVILNLRKLSAKRIDLYIDDPYQAAEMIQREKLNKKINELFARGYVDQMYLKYTGKKFDNFLKSPNP